MKKERYIEHNEFYNPYIILDKLNDFFDKYNFVLDVDENHKTVNSYYHIFSSGELQFIITNTHWSSSEFDIEIIIWQPGIKEILYKKKLKEAEVKDFSEFFDLFHRVQTPYYEEARKYFNCPEVLDYFSDDNEVHPYLPETLKKIIERFSDICG